MLAGQHPLTLPHADQDSYVQKNAATVLRDVAKHALSLSQLIVNVGGVGALAAFCDETSGAVKLPVSGLLMFFSCVGMYEMDVCARNRR